MPSITFLGLTYKLDMLNNMLWNSNRLPRVLLFRQVVRDNGVAVKEPHLETMFMAGIGKIGETDALYYCSQIAKDDESNKWTAVTLHWYGDEKTGHEPNIGDIIEFSPDGSRINERDRRHAKVALARRFTVDREEPVVFAVQASGHMDFLDAAFAAKIYADIKTRWREGDRLVIYDTATVDATEYDAGTFVNRTAPRGGSSIIQTLDWVRKSEITNLLVYSTGQVGEPTIDLTGLNAAMIQMGGENNYNGVLQSHIPVIGKI